ncbi:hypothetical protein BCT92_20575 [Vibrio sp. 10N.261.52.E5]|nr:hypothetical protein A6D97_15680 [Vibrio sp. ZF57]PMK77678.1 hypothetical protein BCT92_20575 [Vibrio sp. 10N.261.52.E5]
MTNRDDKWDVTAICSVLWCGVGILFFKGDYLLAALGSVVYTITIIFAPVLRPVRNKYPYFTLCIAVSFLYFFGIVYLFQLVGLNNLWRTLAMFPLMCLGYWFGTRKVRPILKENKSGSF